MNTDLIMQFVVWLVTVVVLYQGFRFAQRFMRAADLENHERMKAIRPNPYMGREAMERARLWREDPWLTGPSHALLQIRIEEQERELGLGE